jgi:hypothetical protein
MPRGVYKRAKKRKQVKRAMPASNLVEKALHTTEKTSAGLPALPPGWTTQLDARAAEQTVRFSVVIQVDIPVADFDREEANSQARIAGHALEKSMPEHSRLVFVATDEDEG